MFEIDGGKGFCYLGVINVGKEIRVNECLVLMVEKSVVIWFS